MGKVTDPDLIRQLEGGSPVTDPALLSELEGVQKPMAPLQRAAALLLSETAKGVLDVAAIPLGGVRGVYNVAANLGVPPGASYAASLRGDPTAPTTPASGPLPGPRFADPSAQVEQTFRQMGAPTPTGVYENIGAFGSRMLGGGLATPPVGALARAPETLYNAPYTGVMTPKSFATEEARQAGYKFPPSAAGEGTFFTNRMEGIAGKAALKQQATVANQDVTTRLAGQAAGLRPGEQVSEEALSSLRASLRGPYTEVANLSPTAKSALGQLEQARFEKNSWFKYYYRSGNPEALAKAKEFSAQVNALERVIADEGQKAGLPNIVRRLSDARTAIAKTWDVDRALNADTGDVVAKEIAKGGEKLTGDLALIRRFANNYPQFVGEGAKTPAAGVSKLESVAAAGLGMGGWGLFGSPAGVLTGLVAPALPPATRAYLLGPGMAQGGRNYGETLLPSSVFGVEGLLRREE